MEIEEGQSRSIKQLWGKLWHCWVQHELSWYLHHNAQSQDVFSSAKALTFPQNTGVHQPKVKSNMISMESLLAGNSIRGQQPIFCSGYNMVLKQGLTYTLVHTLSLLHEINNYGNNLFFLRLLSVTQQRCGTLICKIKSHVITNTAHTYVTKYVHK